MTNINDLQKRALEIRAKYDAINIEHGNNAWGGKDFAMGLVGDVGDLQKLVMAKEGMRQISDIDTKLAHELSDCLWSIFMIANHYDIDLETAFDKTMMELQTRLARGEE